MLIRRVVMYVCVFDRYKGTVLGSSLISSTVMADGKFVSLGVQYKLRHHTQVTLIIVEIQMLFIIYNLVTTAASWLNKFCPSSFRALQVLFIRRSAPFGTSSSCECMCVCVYWRIPDFVDAVVFWYAFIFYYFGSSGQRIEEDGRLMAVRSFPPRKTQLPVTVTTPPTLPCSCRFMRSR